MGRPGARRPGARSGPTTSTSAAAATDWVNLDKVAIPQADEQQRLLANLIGAMNLDRKPLPRFWYFPRSAQGGRRGHRRRPRQRRHGRPVRPVRRQQPGRLRRRDWECLRFTSYVYPNTPLSNAQAGAYHAQGFEVGAARAATAAATTRPRSLANELHRPAQPVARRSTPASRRRTTNRYHCIVWSDWSSQADAPRPPTASGWTPTTTTGPGSWVADRPGFMTGSGMPMRFTDKTGTLRQRLPGGHPDDRRVGPELPVHPEHPARRRDSARWATTAPSPPTCTPTAPPIFQNDQLLVSALAHGVPRGHRHAVAHLAGRPQRARRSPASRGAATRCRSRSTSARAPTA